MEDIAELTQREDPADVREGQSPAYSVKIQRMMSEEELCRLTAENLIEMLMQLEPVRQSAKHDEERREPEHHQRCED